MPKLIKTEIHAQYFFIKGLLAVYETWLTSDYTHWQYMIQNILDIHRWPQVRRRRSQQRRPRHTRTRPDGRVGPTAPGTAAGAPPNQPRRPRRGQRRDWGARQEIWASRNGAKEEVGNVSLRCTDGIAIWNLCEISLFLRKFFLLFT